MQSIVELYAAHPFWIWMAFGALLLAIEVGTGSGWLLWSAASAGVVALITLAGVTSHPAIDVGVFAALTIVTTLGSRKLVKQIQGEGSDINDQTVRMIGKIGNAAGPFVNGHGRAFVDGSEWQADLEEGGDLAPGARVVVTGVSGSRLKVRAA